MHPKNIFHMRPLLTLLSLLLLVAGPCQFALGWSDQRRNEHLVAHGVEVMAKVISLNGSPRIRSQAAATAGASCRWEVEASGQRCQETFGLPCPTGIESTPMVYVPDARGACRVLSRRALVEDPEPARAMRGGGWLTLAALLLLFLARHSFFTREPQAELKDPH